MAAKRIITCCRSGGAQSVRREIISAFGVDATIVVAIGKGEENPIADNRHADGQARNRRAEVYLANARERNPKRQYGDQDPYLPEIRSLVQAADTLIRQGQLTLAVSKLQQAHALGGGSLFGLARRPRYRRIFCPRSHGKDPGSFGPGA